MRLVVARVSKRDRLWNRFPLEEMKYKYLILSFLRTGVGFRHSTRNGSRIRRAADCLNTRWLPPPCSASSRMQREAEKNKSQF